MTGEGRRYQAAGFIPINEPPARRYITAAAVTILKGDVLHDDGNGLATNATTSFDSATYLGVAAAACASGAECQYYPMDDVTLYMVPVAANAVIAQTGIGLNVDLEAVNTVDINDAVTTGLGFRISAIDISTLAIAANTYGYAIGNFGLIVTES